MPTPIDNPEILTDWQQKFAKERAAGSKKIATYRQIAKDYGANWMTVAAYLDPRYREAKRRGDRIYYKRHRGKKLRERKYQRNYQRLMDNPERLFAKLFESAYEMTTLEITGALPQLCEDVRFRPATVHRLLSRYVSEERGPPYLKEVEPGTYRKVGN